MRTLLSLYTILLLSFGLVNAQPQDSDLPRGQKGRGGDIARESPGLEEAIINYEEAKMLVEEAELLVRDAEKALELAKRKKEQSNASKPEQAGNAAPRAGGDDNDSKPKNAANQPGLDEPREDKPHINDEPGYDESAASSYVMPGDEIIQASNDKPSVCAKYMQDAEAMCAENRPICKYKKVKNPKGNYIISKELADGGDETKCIRRCDVKYGLTPEHCGGELDCITEVSTCGNCDVLSESGPCQYFV